MLLQSTGRWFCTHVHENSLPTYVNLMRLASDYWCWNASALDIPQRKQFKIGADRWPGLSCLNSYPDNWILIMRRSFKIEAWIRLWFWLCVDLNMIKSLKFQSQKGLRRWTPNLQSPGDIERSNCSRLWDSVVPGVSRFLAHGAAVGGNMDIGIVNYPTSKVKRSPCWHQESHAHDKLQQHLPHTCTHSWHHATSMTLWDVSSPSHHASWSSAWRKIQRVAGIYHSWQ